MKSTIAIHITVQCSTAQYSAVEQEQEQREEQEQKCSKNSSQYQYHQAVDNAFHVSP